MCSFEGHFINITEDQLNQGNFSASKNKNNNSGSSFHASPQSNGKRKYGKKKSSATMLFSVANRIPQSFLKTSTNDGIFCASAVSSQVSFKSSKSGSDRSSNKKLRKGNSPLEKTGGGNHVIPIGSGSQGMKKPTLTKKQLKVQAAIHSIPMILQKSQIQMQREHAKDPNYNFQNYTEGAITEQQTPAAAG